MLVPQVAVHISCSHDSGANVSCFSTECRSSPVHADLQEDPLPVLFRHRAESDPRSPENTLHPAQVWLSRPAGDL